MKKLKPIARLEGYLVKSSITMTEDHLNELKALLQNLKRSAPTSKGVCKRMTCAPCWLLLRQSISVRVLIHLSSHPRQVWVIRRQDLNKACKAIKNRNYS